MFRESSKVTSLRLSPSAHLQNAHTLLRVGLKASQRIGGATFILLEAAQYARQKFMVALFKVQLYLFATGL